MTDEQIINFRIDLMKLYDNHRESLANVDYDWCTPEEAILIGISECFRVEKEAQNHPLVISALESCIDGIRHAALDYYVSTK